MRYPWPDAQRREPRPEGNARKPSLTLTPRDGVAFLAALDDADRPRPRLAAAACRYPCNVGRREASAKLKGQIEERSFQCRKPPSASLEGRQIDVNEALELRKAKGASPKFRCTLCDEPVRPHRKGTTGQAAHFEHRTKNPNCALSRSIEEAGSAPLPAGWLGRRTMLYPVTRQGPRDRHRVTFPIFQRFSEADELKGSRVWPNGREVHFNAPQIPPPQPLKRYETLRMRAASGSS